MDELRVIRERKGLSLSQLAARTSIPGRLLSEYEDGLRIITQQHLRALARVLYVNPEDINPRSSLRPQQEQAAPVAQQQPSTTVQSPVVPISPTQVQNAIPTARPAVQNSTPPQHMQQQHAQTPPERTQLPIGSVIRPAPAGAPQEGVRRFNAPPMRPGMRPPRREDGDIGQMDRGGPPRGKPREPKLPPPPQPITPGQINELLRLGARREMSREAIESRIGKPLDQLTRPDARQWIGTLRNEDATDVSVARSSLALPEVIDAFESEYLREMRDQGTSLHFLLFNGQNLTGTVVEFTPYTITIKDNASADEITLRKLAIVYYRKEAEGNHDTDSDEDSMESE